MYKYCLEKGALGLPHNASYVYSFRQKFCPLTVTIYRVLCRFCPPIAKGSAALYGLGEGDRRPFEIIVSINANRRSPGLGISHNADGQEGGGGYDLPRVSKLSVVELSEKQRIGLDDDSRLVVRFYPRSISDPVMSGQMSNFRENGIFFKFTRPYLKKYQPYPHIILTSVFLVQF